MLSKIVAIVIIACVVASTNGQDGYGPQPIPGKSSTAPTTTTSTTTTSTTTTTVPTTTKTTTSTTTTKPTTTTTTKTTPEPTTNPPTTTVEPYPVPTAPTPEPAPTTPKPSPKPPQKPDVGKWNVTDTNVTCIMVDMAIQLNVSYVGNDTKVKHSIVNVPKDAVANGTCGNGTQKLELDWKESNKSFGHLTLEFKENDSNKRFMISNITITIVPNDEIFPDMKNKSKIELFSNKTEFSTPVTKSYYCEKVQSLVLNTTNGGNRTQSEMSVSHVHLEAFHTKKDTNFGAAEDCEPSSTTDIVPIAVGCALVGLVAVVLIAYLVGRRRSQARGYLSMKEEDPDA